MPIKNRPGFVPATRKFQPEHYSEAFGRVYAYYKHPTTCAAIYLQVDADLWNHENPMDACGDLLVLYQADCRHELGRHQTLKEALRQIDAIMSNPKFGENLNPKPLAYVPHGTFWPNKNLTKLARKFRRKANGKPFRLTDSDKETILHFGCTEDDFNQIELAANRATFVLDDTTPVNAYEACEILGRETFLSGLSRAAFHFTCDRQDKDSGKTVSFDTSAIFK